MLARARRASRSTPSCPRSRSERLTATLVALGISSAAIATSNVAAAQAARASPPSDGVQVSGYAQIDWVAHRQSSQDELDPSTREPLNEDRFVLRRARGRLGGASGHFGGRVVFDANTTKSLSVRPFEAVLFARYPATLEPETLSAAEPERTAARSSTDFAATFNVGMMPIPFGFDAMERDLARPLLERAVFTRAFFGQARDLGLGADIAYRFVRLSVAVQNGQPLADDRYAGRDLTRAKDVTARVGVSVPLGTGLWVQAGVSCLFGEGLHLGASGTKDSLAWVDGNENGLIEVTELTPISGTPATPSATFARSALGADARVGVRLPLLGELTLRAEVVRAVDLDRTVYPADPIATGRSLRELGAYVGLSQELTRFAEVAMRYEVYNPDADARRQQAAAVVPSDASYRTWSIAVSGKLAPARVLVQLDHNDNALGRAASGAPTRLRDDALSIRFEGRFR